MAKKDEDTTAAELSAPVAEAINEANEQGFRGVKVDPTPNENYTVAGVTSGAPTPETDPKTAREVRAELEDRRSS